MKISIYSDYICPFCYLLAFKIERLKKEIPLEVEWYPVLSHPEIPDEGLPLEELIRDPEQRKDAVESAMTLARQEGTDLVIPKRVSSSKMAVWMSECARQNGKFEEYHREVYEAYFQRGEDIGDDQTIPKIVRDLNIPREAIVSFCKDRKGYGKAITRRLIECRKREITKVPTMILGQTKIEGSWPYPLLLKAVETVRDLA